MEKRYDLTFPQENIWLVNKLFNSSKTNLITGIININKGFNEINCAKAVNLVIKNNDALRIKIKVEDNNPYQVIEEYVYQDIKIIDMQGFDNLKKEEYISEYKKRDIDILNDKLFEFIVLKYSNDSGAVLLKMHHIVSDAWSYSKIVEQFIKYYNSVENSEEVEEGVTPGYTEYINSTMEYKTSEKYEKDSIFWNEYLEGYNEEISLKSKTKNISNTCKRYNVKLDKKINDSIKEYCKTHRTSPYVLLLAALSTYIYRIKDINDIVIGTPTLNRANFKEKQMLGMFVSTLPLRIKLNESETFLNLVQEIGRNTMGIFRHQKFPYTEIVKNVHDKNNNISKLFSILLSYQNARVEYEDIEKYDTKWYANDHQNEDLQIHMLDMDSTGVLEINYDYLDEIFEDVEIEYLHTRLLAILKHAIEDESIDIENINIMSEEEKNVILSDFNNTKMDYPKDKSIIDLFEEQVEKTPQNIALVFEDRKVTYKELDEMSNSVAHYLRDNEKINKGDIIGIKLNRSVELISAILGVAKIGATYLPIDPTFPIDRIEYIKNNSKAKIIIDNLDKVDYSKTENIKFDFDVNSPFYVLYTSGSTGKPKGVVITCKNMLNFVYGINKIIDINEKNNVLSITTVSFDIFELELWLPLLNGAKLILANDEEKYNPYLLNMLCLKNSVDVMQTTTSVYSSFIHDESNIQFIKNMKKILIGGEKVTENVVNKIKEISNSQIFNVYGPTETTIWSSVKMLNESENINVGKPIMNTKMLILDRKFRILPLGISGELHIAGDSVSKGYLYNETLTNKAFHNIFDEIWYGTGDLAFIGYDLNLKILDRLDLQVKINGRRIEIEEIEKVIYNTGLVKDVIVVVKDNRLICVFNGKLSNIEKLKVDLQNILPVYMVPSIFYKLEHFPMTENKKIDRKKIQAIDFKQNSKEIILPKTSVQEFLYKKISNYLNIDKKISIDTNLFELGLDSLDIIKLVSDINEKYNVHIVPKNIYYNPTIENIEKIILENKSISNDLNINIEEVHEKEKYELTSVQKSIYTEYLKDEKSVLYNLAFEITIKNDVDINRLKESIKKAVLNHKILFSSVIEEDNKLYYKINRSVEYNVECSSVTISEYEQIKNNFVKSFELNKGPLFKIEIYQVNKDIKLLFDFSHLVVDGYSITILLSDISGLYNNNSAQKEKISFGNYIDIMKSTSEDKEFYLKQFPLDNNSTIVGTKINKDEETNTKKGNKIFFNFNKEKVENYCKKNNITINNLIFGIFNVVLSYLSGNNEVIFGVTSIGRNLNIDRNTVGMFVNTIPFKMEIDKNISLLDFFKNTNEKLIDFTEHQNYSYYELLRELNKNNRVNNFINIVYSYQNIGMPMLRLNNNEYQIVEIPTYTSKFDLTLEVIDNKDSINYNVEYNNAYHKNTIDLFINMLYKLTNYIVQESNNSSVQYIYNYLNEISYTTNSNTEKKENDKNLFIKKEENKILNEREKEILAVYREVLNKSELGIKDDFFENGGDSLLVMNLLSKLNNIGIFVTYSDLFKYKNAQELFNHIFCYEKKYYIGNDVSKYDYSKIDNLLNRNIDVDNVNLKNINTVLLIGATGFLGMHMLNELYENNVKKVYCVVREKDNILPKERFYDLLEFYFGEKKANKILDIVSIIEGDITKSNFIENNINKEEIEEIELVINCAARVKHYGDENRFISINIDAVNNLINFCVKNNKELAHVSTLSVSGDFIGGGQIIPEKEEVIFNEKSFYINQNLDNVYAYTKFISEKLIFDAIIMNNLKAKIFRVGNLTGRYDDGKFQKNISENAFVNRIITLMDLKIMPENILDLYIEMTPVDYTAKSIIAICRSDSLSNVFHIYNHNHIEITELIDLLKKIGINITVMKKDEIKKNITYYLQKDPKSIEGIIMDIDNDNNLDYHSNIKIDSAYTRKLLEKIGFKWPKVNNEYFYKFINYIKEHIN